jgi:hypothetical protein
MVSIVDEMFLVLSGFLVQQIRIFRFHLLGFCVCNSFRRVLKTAKTVGPEANLHVPSVTCPFHSFCACLLKCSCNCLKPCTGFRFAPYVSVEAYSFTSSYWLLQMYILSHFREQGVTPVMGVLRPYGTSVLTRVTRRNVPEDGILHIHCRENIKSKHYSSIYWSRLFTL